MHRVDGLDLKFTARTSWMAHVYKAGRLITDVPVAWVDQMTWDPQAKQPRDFVVWFTTQDKAEAWLKRPDALIAVARAVDPREHPRRFASFARLYKVRPIGLADERGAVKAGYQALVTSENIDQHVSLHE